MRIPTAIGAKGRPEVRSTGRTQWRKTVTQEGGRIRQTVGRPGLAPDGAFRDRADRKPAV